MSEPTHIEPQVSFLVLDFRKEPETRACLESIRRHAKLPHKTVLLDNGGSAALAIAEIMADASDHSLKLSDPSYPWQLYQEGLCDTLISKRAGRGGGHGQTDLFRWCDTPYAIFVQNDQELVADIDEAAFAQMVSLLNTGLYQCIDLNGDQSGRGVWTDRAHLVRTDFFNGLGPFPNGGPGHDAAPWNEAYLQRVFAERGYRIFHAPQRAFIDCGRTSVREAGDGLYQHECDTKCLTVLKQPTHKTEVYPPFSDEEWSRVLAGQWRDGDIPEQWKPHSFTIPHWH